MNSVRGRISVEECRRSDRDGKYAEYWDSPGFGFYLERNASERPSALAVSDPDITLTWEELRIAVDGGTQALDAAGVRAGDIVVIRGGNSVDLMVWMLAIMGIGAVLCPVQDRATASELAFVLDQSESRFFLQMDCAREGEYRDGLVPLVSAYEGICRFGVASLNGTGGQVHVGWLGADSPEVRSESPIVPWSMVQGASPLRLLYTSGSTGTPKGVLHTNDTTVFACGESVRLHGWSSNSVGWIAVPITLNWGMFQMFSGIIAGAHVIMRRRFDSAELISAIRDGLVTHIGLPPTGYIKLLDDLPPSTGRPGRLEALVSAGAPCGGTLLERLREAFGIDVAEAYGMTEAGWVASSSSGYSSEASSASVGTPTIATSVRIVTADGSLCDVGEIGAVEINGPSVFCGYYRNPEQTTAAFTDDGWFRTGDRGFLYPDGRLTLAGRDKDVIKHGGQLVVPREIEEVLSTLANVRDVVVVGLPDDYYGEKIVAVIERSAAPSPDLSEIQKFVDGKLAKFKWPQEVILVDELPRTSTGKVQKHLLVRELANRNVESQSGLVPN